MAAGYAGPGQRAVLHGQDHDGLRRRQEGRRGHGQGDRVAPTARGAGPRGAAARAAPNAQGRHSPALCRFRGRPKRRSAGAMPASSGFGRARLCRRHSRAPVAAALSFDRCHDCRSHRAAPPHCAVASRSGRRAYRIVFAGRSRADGASAALPGRGRATRRPAVRRRRAARPPCRPSTTPDAHRPAESLPAGRPQPAGPDTALRRRTAMNPPQRTTTTVMPRDGMPEASPPSASAMPGCLPGPQFPAASGDRYAAGQAPALAHP